MNGRRWCSYFSVHPFSFPSFLSLKCHSLKNVVIFPRELIYFSHSHSKAHTFFSFFLLWREISPMFWFPRWKWYRRRRFLIPSSSRQPQLISCRCFALQRFFFKQQQTDRTTRNISSFLSSFRMIFKRHFFFLRVSSVSSPLAGRKEKKRKGLTLGYRSPDRPHWSYYSIVRSVSDCEEDDDDDTVLYLFSSCLEGCEREWDESSSSGCALHTSAIRRRRGTGEKECQLLPQLFKRRLVAKRFFKTVSYKKSTSFWPAATHMRDCKFPAWHLCVCAFINYILCGGGGGRRWYTFDFLAHKRKK